MNKLPFIALAAAVFSLGISGTATAEIDAGSLFKKKCKMCHALDKKKVGPAVRGMNVDAEVLKETIINGRKMMPKFGKKLSGEEIDALVAYIVSNNPTANPCATGQPCDK
ncbi:MAG: c-type cytochrome [Mariprofundaceae bacterium]